MTEMEKVDLLTSPEVLALMEQVRKSAPALTHVLQRLEQASKSGALDTVLDLADVVQAARVSMSDAMIGRMANGTRVLLELVDILMVSGVPDKAPALLNAAIDARDDAAADDKFFSPIDLLTAPKSEELQFVLKFILAFAKRLPAAMKG